jgi:hypothetical protein
MIKKIFLLLLVIVLAGCANLSQKEIKNPSVKEIDAMIKQSVDISSLEVMEYVKLKKLYGISKTEIDDFVFYRAPSNVKAEEILIIKVKDGTQVESVKEKIDKRIARQAASFKDYLPNEYYLIEKSVVEVYNNYILLAVSNEALKIKLAFSESFK